MIASIINNQEEYSRSIPRPGGMTLDICAFKADHVLVIAVVNEDEVHVQEVSLSLGELEVLKQHLNDPEVMKILGSQEISSVKCPTCGQMVQSFRGHPC
jgi:hypothetical protein